jgi:hypothetical protein
MFGKDIVGPLSKNYCNIYWVFSIIHFIGFVLAIITLIWALFMSKKKRDFIDIVPLLAAPFYTFMSYLLTRLLYNMCINSIH